MDVVGVEAETISEEKYDDPGWMAAHTRRQSRTKERSSIGDSSRMTDETRQLEIRRDSWRKQERRHRDSRNCQRRTTRKKHELCTTCGRLGHRADVCPAPNTKKCRGCRMLNPAEDHQCDPRCSLCGKAHLTGDKKCRELFKNTDFHQLNGNTKDSPGHVLHQQSGPGPHRGRGDRRHQGRRPAGLEERQQKKV
ncbi:hypothetical protein HPB52_021569 [Rhipicephalus sanguineus]|uniref:CCHC-type domain-containing protein n=1 Tax=Rhipicephalus sanguineus TaxID=34632 RepID=A0A9D4SNA7_RHISA|nr:hypothetical protein HPB52_021569 [Rhipicephalus sanguineus]